jgi:hypothetical protein
MRACTIESSPAGGESCKVHTRHIPPRAVCSSPFSAWAYNDISKSRPPAVEETRGGHGDEGKRLSAGRRNAGGRLRPPKLSAKE